MNLPTKITVSRIVSTPLFFVFFMLPQWVSFASGGALPVRTLFILNVVSTAAAWLFLVMAELSDAADGFIARRYHLVTDLGKLLDPFSDVLIHITYFLCFAAAGLMPFWVLAVILYREFFQLFIRMLSLKSGTVVPANIWGKSKSVLYAAASLAGLAAETFFRFAPDGGEAAGGTIRFALTVLFVVAAAVSVVSFLTYLIPFLKTRNAD